MAFGITGKMAAALLIALAAGGLGAWAFFGQSGSSSTSASPSPVATASAPAAAVAQPGVAALAQAPTATAAPATSPAAPAATASPSTGVSYLCGTSNGQNTIKLAGRNLLQITQQEYTGNTVNFVGQDNKYAGTGTLTAGTSRTDTSVNIICGNGNPLKGTVYAVASSTYASTSAPYDATQNGAITTIYPANATTPGFQMFDKTGSTNVTLLGYDSNKAVSTTQTFTQGQDATFYIDMNNTKTGTSYGYLDPSGNAMPDGVIYGSNASSTVFNPLTDVQLSVYTGNYQLTKFSCPTDIGNNDGAKTCWYGPSVTSNTGAVRFRLYMRASGAASVSGSASCIFAEDKEWVPNLGVDNIQAVTFDNSNTNVGAGQSYFCIQH